MADPNEELMTLRITSAVTEAVDQAIRRRYIWVNLSVGAAIVVAGLFGGAALITSTVKDQVDAKVSSILSDTQANTKLVSELNGQQKEMRSHIIEYIDELKSKSEKLKTELDDMDTQVRQMTYALDDRAVIKNQLASQSHSISVLQEQANRIADLANTVQQLNTVVTGIAVKVQTDTSALAKAPSPQAISSSLTEANTGLGKPTVFFQFSGAISRAEVQQISAALKERGFRVPGEERVAGSAREVRYYYRDDQPVAEDLARKTTDILGGKGLGNIQVQAKSLINYAGTKPPTGTVELWLGELPHLN